MSGAGAFPFDPEKLARLAAFSASTRAGAGAMPPIGAPIQIDGGFASAPTPDGRRAMMWVHAGLSLAWSPADGVDGVLLFQFGGRQDGEVEDGIVSFLTRAGLRTLVADLQSIDAQLGVER